MKRRYYRRGRLVEVEQLDDVVAVNGPSRGGEVEDRSGPSARDAVRDAVPGLDDSTLDAFADADWHIVRPSAEARDRAGTGPGDEARDGSGPAAGRRGTDVGTVVVGSGGRVGIATDLLNVRLADDLTEAECEQALGQAGLVVVNTLHFAPHLYEVRTLRGDAIDASLALHDDPRFVFAEPSFIEHIPQRFTPADPRYGEQWQWRNVGSGGGTPGADVNVEPAWDHTFGTGVRVAVIDNGFDADHQDLSAGVGPGSGYFTTSAGVATFRPGVVGMPDSDHGTFCAGMVGARSGNGIGGVGAAPDCELMLLACLNDQVGTQTTLASCLAYAADPSTQPGAPAADGADIIVSSLGPNGADWALTSTLELAIEHAATRGRNGRGCAIFWAASNGNVDVMLDEVVSHPDVIAVVRSTRNDREDNAAHGPEVELIAPGVNVVSTRSGNRYGTATGTSFAAPCTAGCAALALAVNPALNRDELRAILRGTADQIGGVGYDATGHNDDYGYGRPNAWNAVRAAARRVQLSTPAVLFDGVPAGATATDTVRWEVSGLDALTFAVESGPDPAGPFAVPTPTVSVPAPGVAATAQAALTVRYTGTAAGATDTAELVVREVTSGRTWTITLSGSTAAARAARVGEPA